MRETAKGRRGFGGSGELVVAHILQLAREAC